MPPIQGSSQAGRTQQLCGELSGEIVNAQHNGKKHKPGMVIFWRATMLARLSQEFNPEAKGNPMFKALLLTKTPEGATLADIASLDEAQLPEG